MASLYRKKLLGMQGNYVIVKVKKNTDERKIRVSSMLYLLIKINLSSKGYSPSTEVKLLYKESVKVQSSNNILLIVLINFG